MSEKKKNLDNYKSKRRHHKRDRSSSSSASSSSDDGSASSSLEGSWSSSGGSSYSSSRSGSSSASSSYEEKSHKKSSKKTLAASSKPTSEAVRTVEYHTDYVTNPGERFDSAHELKHNGDWVLTVGNERLDQGTVLNKDDLGQEGRRCREMVTAIRVKNLKLEGCTHPVLLEFPTVPAYKGESFCGKSHFCKRFNPAELSGDGFTGTLLQRNPSEAATNYQKKYGLDAQNFQDHVQRPKGLDFSLVPLNSPVVVFYNDDPANRKCKITKASKGFEKEKLVKMERAKEEKYSEQALKQISQKLPHGDVTHKFQVRVSGVVPSDRRDGHRLWREKTDSGAKPLSAQDEKKGKAIRHESMADFGTARPNMKLDAKEQNGKTAYENFTATRQGLSGTFECDYILVEADANTSSKKSSRKK